MSSIIIWRAVYAYHRREAAPSLWVDAVRRRILGGAAQPATLCPILEYLIKWNEIHQHFFRNPLKPVNGIISVPTGPGMGMELDETKIETERELRWSA